MILLCCAWVWGAGGWGVSSFAQRPDVEAIDEPLYASHLSRNPHLQRPYRDELLRAQSTDAEAVLKTLHKAADKPLRVCKHMAKHINGIPLHQIAVSNARHILLIREPLGVLQSVRFCGEEEVEIF